jgi:threonine/homoserine/homoserine lactone efflux protein
MIALAAMGLAVVLHTSEYLFLAIKVLGAGYLFYIAWQLWRAPVGEARVAGEQPRGTWKLARQEFWVAAGNPKAILIFTAFLPQFVTVGGNMPVSEQFLQLGVLFLLLEWAAIAIYAGLGAYLQRWFERPGPRRVFNRVSASLLGCAGLGCWRRGARTASAGPGSHRWPPAGGCPGWCCIAGLHAGSAPNPDVPPARLRVAARCSGSRCLCGPRR